MNSWLKRSVLMKNLKLTDKPVITTSTWFIQKPIWYVMSRRKGESSYVFLTFEVVYMRKLVDMSVHDNRNDRRITMYWKCGIEHHGNNDNVNLIMGMSYITDQGRSQGQSYQLFYEGRAHPIFGKYRERVKNILLYTHNADNFYCGSHPPTEAQLTDVSRPLFTSVNTVLERVKLAVYERN